MDKILDCISQLNIWHFLQRVFCFQVQCGGKLGHAFFVSQKLYQCNWFIKFRKDKAPELRGCLLRSRKEYIYTSQLHGQWVYDM